MSKQHHPIKDSEGLHLSPRHFPLHSPMSPRPAPLSPLHSPMSPRPAPLSPLHSPMSPRPSPLSPVHHPLFSQTQLPFPQPFSPPSQPQDLVETDFPSDVDTCQLLSPLSQPSLRYGYQDYTQDQSYQQSETHPDPDTLQDYHNHGSQTNLNHQLDRGKNHQLDQQTNHSNRNQQRQLKTHKDHQTPNSYQDPLLDSQTMYSNEQNQQNHHMKQQSLDLQTQLDLQNCNHHQSQQMEVDHHQHQSVQSQLQNKHQAVQSQLQNQVDHHQHQSVQSQQQNQVDHHQHQSVQSQLQNQVHHHQHQSVQSQLQNQVDHHQHQFVQSQLQRQHQADQSQLDHYQHQSVQSQLDHYQHQSVQSQLGHYQHQSVQSQMDHYQHQSVQSQRNHYHHQTVQSQLQSQKHQVRLCILAQLQRQEQGQGGGYCPPQPPSQNHSHTQQHTHISYTQTQTHAQSSYMYTQAHADQQPSPCLYTQPAQSPLTSVETTSTWYPGPQSYSNPYPFPHFHSHPNSNFNSHPQSNPSTHPHHQSKYSLLPNTNPTYSPNPNPNPHPNPNPNPNPSHNPNPNPNPSPNPKTTYSPNPKPTYSPNPNPNPNPTYSPNPNPNPNPTYSPKPNPNPTYSPNPNPTYSPNPNPNPTYSPNPNTNHNPTYIPNPNPNPTYSSHPNHSPYSYPHLSPQSSPIPHPNQPSPSPSYFPYPNPSPRRSPLYLSPPLLLHGGWESERGVSPAVQQMTTERRGPHANHLNQLNHLNHLNQLNHLKPLYSPPAQQTQMPLTEHLGDYETPNCSRLLCSVCQRVFKSLPALNGHMRSHGGLRGQTGKSQTYRTQKEGVIPGSPVPIVMPVSVPVRLPASHLPCLEEERQEGEDEGRREWKERKKDKRRYPHHHSPLILPCQSTRGAVVFQSVLRSTVQQTYYTPPPMLSPDREGTGLYCSLTTSDGDMLMSGEQPIKIKPRINVGIGFQADVPPLQDQRHSHSDPHNALVLWTPWDALENSSTQHRVECLLMMSCSSVCPGGGTNSEYALHSLSESRGDFLGTLEKMLLQHWPMTPNSLSSYHYAGSDKWSPVEKRLVKKAFMMYQKDFHRIHKTVGTKSVSQCVEYYYTWKRRLRLNVRNPVGLASTLPEVHPSQPTMNGKMGLHTISTKNACQPIHSGSSCPLLQVGSGSGCCSQALGEVERPNRAHFYGPVCLRMSPSLFSSSPRPSNSPPSAKHHPEPTPPYPCRACTKVFSKVKSRNAHMKTHRQEDHQEELH